MTTFVLVPGFWMGAWAWDAVVGPLRAAGHDARPLTLPGLDGTDPGAVTVADHVDAVVTAVATAPDPVVLVGHSAGGPVSAAAADRAPGRLAHLVHVDTGPLPDGWAQVDFHPPAGGAAIRAAIGSGPVYAVPPDVELDAGGSSRTGIGADEWARVRKRCVGQPARTVLDPIPRGSVEPGLPRTVVATSFPAAAVSAMAHRFPEMAGPDWSAVELPTGHWPMFSRPVDLAALLGGLPLR